MTAYPWRMVPVQNCRGTVYNLDGYYALPATFLVELRQMAYLLSSGERIDADQRRDMAQRIQAVLGGHETFEV